MAAANLDTTMAKRLQGKVAVITGGASGIGEATAKLFVRYGAKVVVADIQDDRGQALCKELASSGTISYAHCDVTKESDVKDVVDYAVSEHGKLDIMFNNAGIAPPMLTPVLEIERSVMEKVFGVNVYGAFFGAKHAARVMMPAKSGSIIFTASATSVIDMGGPLPYSCSKHAVVGLTTHLCAELGKYGIRVNCISPFMIHTGLLDSSLGSDLDPRLMPKWISAASNLKEAALEVNDVAEAAAYLGSDESKYVSGLNLVIDGGYSKTNPSLIMAVNASATSS